MYTLDVPASLLTNWPGPIAEAGPGIPTGGANLGLDQEGRGGPKFYQVNPLCNHELV